MPSPRYTIYIDTASRKSVAGLTSTSERSLPTLVQGETISVEIFFLEPTGTITAPYDKVDMSGHTLKVGLCGGGGVPIGTSGPVLVAYQDTWVWDGTNEKFTGSLVLNTTDLATFIGAASSKSSTLEVEATPSGGSPIKYLQAPVTVKAEVIEQGSMAPTPSSEYYTKVEADATFLAIVGSGTFSISDPNSSTTIAVSGMTTNGIAFATLNSTAAAAGGTISNVSCSNGSITIQMGSNPGNGNTWDGKYIIFTNG